VGAHNISLHIPVTTAPTTAVLNETLREQESKKRRHKIQANPLHGGATIIEVPDAGRCEIHVRYPDAINMTSQREESRLGFLAGDETPRNAEAAGMRPTVRTMVEFGHLPIGVDGMVVQAL